MLLMNDRGRETIDGTSEAAPAPRGKARSAIVIGAGVVGMATGYALARRGIAVSVIESREAPGFEASFANGAQLSYAYTDALACPALLRHMPAVLLGLDSAIRLRPSFDRDYLVWLLRFLRNTTASRFMENTLAGLELGLESRLAMHAMQERHHLDFDHSTPGKLHIHSSSQGLSAAGRLVAVKNAFGAEQQVLGAADAIRLEPALADHGPFAGAVYTPGDEVGDPQRFCAGMATLLQKQFAVSLRLGTSVEGLGEDNGEAWVRTSSGERLAADDLVICAGIASSRLAARLGLRSALMPMKGYSFTAPAGYAGLRVSITDVARKIVFCRLGDRVRVAGMAEIGERSTAVDRAALERLRSGARASLPSAVNYDHIGPGWAGIRPMTASSLPHIERISPRIAVNIGHGMLGWTYSMGSAERLAKVIVEKVA